MGLVWKLLQTATPLRPVSRWPRYTLMLREWPPGRYQTIPGFRCVSEKLEDKNNPLTAALEFVSITRSSSEVHSLVAEMVACSFSGTGSSWTQLIVKNFAQSELLTLDFGSVTLTFLGTRRGNQGKRLDDIVLSNQQGGVLHHPSCQTILVSQASCLDRALLHSLLQWPLVSMNLRRGQIYNGRAQLQGIDVNPFIRWLLFQFSRK